MLRNILLGLAAVVVAALCGAYFILSQPDIPRRLLEAKYAGAPSRFVALNDGTRVHYRDRGPRGAPVLVLLHGANSSLFDWEPWSKILADKFRFVSVDLPGCGLTGAVASGDYSQAGMAAFVRAFADKLGLRAFALAGNSMGGGVAARFAETYPARVTHLILLDASGAQISSPPRHYYFMRLARTPILGELAFHITPRSFVAGGLHGAVERQSVIDDAMIDRNWDFLRMQGSRRALLERFRLKPDSAVWQHVRAIKAPTLILWGHDDRVIPIAAAHAWAKAIPGSKLIVYPDTGHLPMVEAAGESAGDVRAFLSAPAR